MSQVTAMIYKIIIITLILCAISFGTGMSMNFKSIKHMALFRLGLFWSLILCSVFADVYGRTIIKYQNYSCSIISFTIVLLLGLTLTAKGLKNKHKIYSKIANSPILKSIIYICANTFIIISAFSISGVYFKNAALSTAVFELIFLNFGLLIGEKVNRVYKYNTDVWQVVSGCLILISLILYI